MHSQASANTTPALVIWALGVTQIIGYGTLYYSFGALAPSMALEFGWPEEWVFGALSGSLLIGGLVAPLSGRLADRHGAARIMVWGSLAAAIALAACSLAPNGPSFVLGLVAMEVAAAFVLYATAFAALAQVSGQGAQRAITHLTLVAGFASTIFWPLTAALHVHLDWREVYLIFAALNLMVALPIHFWLARQAVRQGAVPRIREAVIVPGLVPSGQRLVALFLMLLGFALLGFSSSAILVHMLPMLAALDLGASGVLVTTLFGPAQVLGRLINMQFGKGLSQPALGTIATGLMPLGLVVLLVSAPWLAGAAVFAVLFGLGSGLSSIVSGTLPLALFGTEGYGERLGWISSARLIVSALAPFVFSLLVAVGSIRLTLALVILVGIAATGTFAVIWWRWGRSSA